MTKMERLEKEPATCVVVSDDEGLGEGLAARLAGESLSVHRLAWDELARDPALPARCVGVLADTRRRGGALARLLDWRSHSTEAPPLIVLGDADAVAAALAQDAASVADVVAAPASLDLLVRKALLLRELWRARRAVQRSSRELFAQRLLHEQLESERGRLESVLEWVPVGIVIAAASGERVIYANAQTRAILGLDDGLASTRVLAEVLRRPGSAAALGDGEMPLARALQRGEHVRGEAFDVATLGGARHVAISATPIYNDTSDIVAAVAVLQDLTKEQEREERLRREVFTTAQLARLIELSPDAIVVRDLDDTVVFWSRGAEEVYGYAQGEVLGRSIHDVLKTELDPTLAAARDALMKHGRWQGELEHVRRDGRRIVAASRWALQRDELGAPYRILEINTDVTAKRAVERELRAAKDAAEAASRAKSQFVANVSHEIRTPLGAMMGFAELLSDPSSTKDEQREFVDVILRNGRLLAQLIDDILDLSKVEAGKLTLESASCSIARIVADVRELLGPRAADQRVALTWRIAPEVPDTFTSDPTRLKQILLNIVGNAVKFTRDGRVDVGVDLLPAAAGAPERIAFSVRDTGRGIPREQQAQLFQPFVQADASTTRHYGGTGLGLALSRRLARMLGGDVELLASEVGGGSTFVVTVGTGRAADAVVAGLPPCGDGVTTASPVATRTPLTGINVLCVEDTPDNRTLMRQVLRACGASVDFALHGDEALEMVMRREYDVVLMDLQMPVRDGFDTTAVLRRRGFGKPIIAVSAAAMPEERRRALAAGCDDHLTKPINSALLVQTIDVLVRGRSS